MNAPRWFLPVVVVVMLLHAGVWADCEPCDRQSNAGFLPGMTGQSNQFAVRRSGAEVDAKWKIDISRDGWYRITQSQMVAAGMPAGQLIGSQIRMFTRTQEVALLVSATNLLDGGDAIYFYGMQHDGIYSRTNAYWLGLGGEGRRIETISGSTNNGGTTVTSACFSAVYNPKNLHRPFHQPLNADIDHWFAEAVFDNQNTGPILINTSNRVLGQDAVFSLTMFGLTTSNHQTRITLNGNIINTSPYVGPILYSTNIIIPTSYLTPGIMSSMTLRQIGTNASTPQDFAYLIETRIDYPARIRMRSNAQEFCGRPGTNIYNILSLFTNVGNTILDISDPYAPVRITDATFTASPSVTNFIAEFRHVTTNVHRYMIVQSNGIINAMTPQAVTFRNLGDTARSADYLLICPYAFRTQAYRLAKHRFTNGLNVVVAPLPDIYNEFGYGIVDADTIKQFVGYVFHHWTPPRPRFALLMGEGTYDPLGHIGSVPSVNLPTKFGISPFVIAAKDTWYGLVDGDDLLPDVMIGRMSVSSTVFLSNIVSKVIAFDGATITNTALLVADNGDTNNNFFGSSTTNIFHILFSNGFSITSTMLPLNPSQARPTISNNFNRRVVSYVGHGAVDRWSSVNAWNTLDTAGLNNTFYPLVAIFSCNNGSFVDRQTNCLSEVMIESYRGASSVFSPTALSVQQYADLMANGFMNGLAVDKRRYLGDIAYRAYLSLFNFNPNVSELETYQILGDPGLLVNRPGTLP